MGPTHVDSIRRVAATRLPTQWRVYTADNANQLARILGAVGRSDEFRDSCQLAVARYDDVGAAHPEAFADHAAEIYLAAGNNPVTALGLIRTNFGVRQTPRARDLFN